MTLLILTAVLFWKPQPRPVHTQPPRIQWRWYMGKDGHAVHCTGQPRFAYPPLRRVVCGCQGLNPVFEVDLKD